MAEPEVDLVDGMNGSGLRRDFDLETGDLQEPSCELVTHAATSCMPEPTRASRSDGPSDPAPGVSAWRQIVSGATITSVPSVVATRCSVRARRVRAATAWGDRSTLSLQSKKS